MEIQWLRVPVLPLDLPKSVTLSANTFLQIYPLSVISYLSHIIFILVTVNFFLSSLQQSQSKCGVDRSAQRIKKPKENKPKVKKLKYHQYIPPDQKNDREPPPQLDSSYAKILHQQQLFLQLQIISQQQQHYNYHTILPAPPK